MWGFNDDAVQTFGLLDDFRRRMDRLFDEVGTGNAWDEQVGGPRVNLSDTGGELVFEAEVPGVAEKDLGLTLTQDSLSLTGSRDLALPENASVHRRERGQVRFARSIALPVRVDTTRTAAALKDGILTVTMPKAEDVKPRQITIKASS
jgi:HSP20 family protein